MCNVQRVRVCHATAWNLPTPRTYGMPVPEYRGILILGYIAEIFRSLPASIVLREEQRKKRPWFHYERGYTEQEGRARQPPFPPHGY